MRVQFVQTWPKYKSRYVVEGEQSTESMLTIRIRGITMEADATDKQRVGDSRVSSPILPASPTRASTARTGGSPARTMLPPSVAFPTMADTSRCAENVDANADAQSVCEEHGMGISGSASDNTCDSAEARSVPASPPVSPNSPPARAGRTSKGCQTWWMIRVSSLTQLARVVVSFQRMNPASFNAHELLLPAKTGLLALYRAKTVATV